MSDKVEDILYQAHDEGIYKEVMAVSRSLDGKHYWSVADKFEEAYRIVKTKREKGYESKHLDKKRRGNKR
tara:strand:- start:1075 stop:1284 length:210 start_codon:yes stop_codon:yes gene_type:complete